MKVVIIKFRSSMTWSDSIELFTIHASDILKDKSVGLEVIDVTSRSFFRKIFEIRKKNADIYLVHHTLPLWCYFLASFFSKKKAYVVSFLHEGEQLFSLSQKLEPELFRKKLSNIIRGSDFFHKIPQRVSDRTFVLSNPYLSVCFGNNKSVLRFIGIDKNFCDKKTHLKDDKVSRVGSGLVKVLFPHDAKRPDKGFKFLEEYCQSKKSRANSISILLPHYCSNKEMSALYNRADIVVVPTTTYETFSLVALEAMNSNKFLIVSNKAGVTEHLLERYDEPSLRKIGVYIFFELKEFFLILDEVRDRVVNKEFPKTKELFFDLKFDSLSTTQNVLEVIFDEYQKQK